jgi:hypothetical protein
MMPPSIVRVFLSSPGDVSEERRLLGEVLNRVARDPMLQERVHFELSAYDDPDAQTPMAANESPQQSVNRYKRIPSECDLTVVILWGRFGTKLPADLLKPDGSRYESGTEWEYEDALRAGKTVWVYHRRPPPMIHSNDPDQTEKVNQRIAVERFINRFTNPDGSHSGGYTVYDSPDRLTVLFEQHLKSYLRDRLDGRSRRPAATFRMGELSFPNPTPDLDKYYVDFGRELEVGKQLVGRTVLFARLADFSASHSRGYFRVTADAGLGKTTFAAAVAVQQSAAAFFVNASRGVSRAAQCMNHLCATLIARFALSHDDLPPNSGDSSALFETVLAEAVTKSGGPLWLVVDGLDEADTSVGRNVLLLPQSLPNGVYCLVTQRPGHFPLFTLPDTPLGGYEIGSDSPLQQADVDEYLSRQLARPEISQRLDARQSGSAPESVLERLRTASQGNFRYLSYVLADLASGDLPPDTQDLPQGLLSYYGTTLTRMEAAAEAKSGKESKRLYRRVLGLLAVAREPVTVGWLAELSSQDPADIRDEVLRTWRRYLSRERGKTERWRFPDRGFGDFLADQLVLEEQHASIAAHYRPQPAWRKHEGYAARNLTTHLRLAGDMDGLASLVDHPDWCDSQLLIDPTGAAYQNDLRQACEGATAIDKAELEEGRLATCLSSEVRWAFAAASLRGYWFNVWPEMLAEFVSARILNEGQVVAWASRIPREFDRGRALEILAPVLSPVFRLRAIQSIRAIDDEEIRVDALLAFAREMEGDERTSLIFEALSIIRTMPDDLANKVTALAIVADMNGLPREEHPVILREAAAIADRLDDRTERAKALLSLLAVSPEPCTQLDVTVAAIRSLDDPSQVNDDISATLERISDAAGAELGRAMVEDVERIPDLDRQFDWLKSAMGALNDAERSELVSKIRALIGSVADPERHANLLLRLSDLGSERERIKLLNEAEAAINLMQDGAPRSIQICELAARLSGERATQLWRESVARLTEQSGAIAAADAVVNLATSLPERLNQAALVAAETVVRSLPDSMPKARLLIHLAQAFEDNTSRSLVCEVARVPGGVLAAGVQTPDEIELLELLGALGARLTPKRREALAQRAEGIANGLSAPYARGCALAALLPISATARRRQIVDSIRVAVGEVANADERTELLLAVLPEVPSDERDAVIEDAVATARAIVPGEVFTTVEVNTKTLFTTGLRIPNLRGCPSKALVRIAEHADGRRSALLEEAYGLTFRHPAAWQAEALAELAPHLSEGVTIATITAVRALLLDPVRETLRSVLQERAAATDSGNQTRSNETDDAETNDAGEQYEARESYNVLSPDQWFRLDSEGLASSTITLGDSPATEDDAASPTDPLTPDDVRGIGEAALSGFSHEDLEQANYMVNAVVRAWHAAMGQLLKRWAELTSPDAALRQAHATWPSGAPPSVAAALLPLTTGEEKNWLLDAAAAASEALRAPENRVRALLGIYPHLRGQKRETALDRLKEDLQRVEAIDVAELAATTYSEAPELPRVDLRELLHRVLHSIDERELLAPAVRQMIPVMEALGGAEALSDIADAILEIRGRWV